MKILLFAMALTLGTFSSTAFAAEICTETVLNSLQQIEKAGRLTVTDCLNLKQENLMREFSGKPPVTECTTGEKVIDVKSVTDACEKSGY